MAKRNSGGGGLLLVVLLVLLALAYNETQQAGATDTSPAEGGEYLAPTDGQVTSGYGSRGGAMHYGLDIAAPLGTPIVAAADGTVIDAGPASGFGRWVRIRHDSGTVTVYGHMHTITTHTGAHVAGGEQIATVGARGQSTGPHLHFEVWPNGQRASRIDPHTWLAEHGVQL